MLNINLVLQSLIFIALLLIISCYFYYKRKKSRPQNFEEAILQDRIHVRALQAQDKSTATTLLISCVDFRLREETERLMNENFKLLNDYDEIALPGGALALIEETHPHWRITMEETIGLLKDLHQIERVVFLNHRECGAFRLLKGQESIATKDLETKTHQEVFKDARAKMKREFPDLKVYTLLIGLDGVAENLKQE